MYSATRRTRHWLLSSRFLIFVVGAIVLGISVMDGTFHGEIEHKELWPLLVVLAIAFYVAYRADKLHARVDDLERRLTMVTQSTNS